MSIGLLLDTVIVRIGRGAVHPRNPRDLVLVAYPGAYPLAAGAVDGQRCCVTMPNLKRKSYFHDFRAC